MVPRRSIALVVPAAVVAALLLPASPGFAATMAVNCNTQELQQKIDAAPASTTLLLSGICYGNFHLDKNLTLKGNPSATLDGNDLATTLTITGSPTVHL